MPRTFARTGAIGNFFFIAQWFPKLGVLQDGGWNCHQFHAGTEFFSDYGVYDVSLTVPAGWPLGATGVQRERRDNADGTTTHRYYQEDVHDFAWTTSPDYLERTARFEHPTLPPVEMRLLLQPEHAGQAERHFDATRTTLKYYGEWFGAYPYGHITIVDPAYQSGAGGMEYPTLFTAGTRWLAPARRHHAGRRHRPRSRPPVLVRHRRQQRVRGCVDGRGVQHLLDRARDRAGLRSELPGAALLRRVRAVGVQGHRAQPRDRRQPSRRAIGATRRATRSRRRRYRYFPVDRRQHHLQQDRAVAEHDGALARMADAAARHVDAFRRAGSSSIRGRTISSRSRTTSAGRDLGWFFDQVYRSSNVFDYGVQDLKSARDGDAVPHDASIVRRYGEAIFPVDVLVTFANGERVIEHWDGKDRWKLYTYDRPAPALSAQVDPNRVLLLDINYTNNSRTLEPQGGDGGDEMVADVDGVAAGLPAVVGGARMSAFAAWRDGVRRVNRAPAILLGVWALTLLVSVPMAVGDARHAGAASRREPRRRHGRERRELRLDAGVRRPGVAGSASTFKPTIIGFGAVLDNLSAFLDDTPRPIVIVGAAAVYIVLWIFVAGGIIDRYARDRADARVRILRRRRACSSSGSCGWPSCSGSSTRCCSARCTRGCSTGSIRASRAR